MITPNDITGAGENVARRLLVAARSIAPCIDSFPDDSEQKKDAIAILLGVLESAPGAGQRRVRAQRIGSASVDYWNADTWQKEDRDALRSLCGASGVGGAPRGSFPDDRPIGRLWPETYT